MMITYTIQLVTTLITRNNASHINIYRVDEIMKNSIWLRNENQLRKVKEVCL